MFDRDKLIVATLMTSQILLADGRIDPGEYNLLLNKKVALQPPPITDELSNWMADAQWAGLVPLEASLPCFNGLAKDMERNSEKWELWTKNERCETQPLPGDWAKNLSRFRTMLLIRAMRPDRITAALSQYVQEQMGEEYVKQEIFSASEMIKESSPATPIFFILFPGYSPSKEIEALATSLGLTAANGQLTIISMGQGQEPIAESVLDKYTQNGGWVFLDNVHLMQARGAATDTPAGAQPACSLCARSLLVPYAPALARRLTLSSPDSSPRGGSRRWSGSWRSPRRPGTRTSAASSARSRSTARRTPRSCRRASCRRASRSPTSRRRT